MTLNTGRVASRRVGYCLGCEARIRLGDPKPNTTWPARLRELMSDELHALLLIAAAEYRELCEACFHCNHEPHNAVCREKDCTCADYLPTDEPDPVDLLDWVWPPVGTGGVPGREIVMDRIRGVA